MENAEKISFRDLPVIPQHIAIIMDGNGRWAKERGLERLEGHKAGAEAVLHLLDYMKDSGVQYMTLYAFSTENWKRSKEEVDGLMLLLCEFIDSNMDLMMKNDLRLLVSGRLHGLPPEVQSRLNTAMEKSASNKSGTVIFALNYGGRAEIADAASRIAQEVLEGKILPEEINEKSFARYLYLPEVPDPDLLIRTSGEMRLSNFLLWELSYSEIYVTDLYWPDFTEKELYKAMESFAGRNRRFGGR
jgi:undecaprenyl diphosphate synthase